MQILGPSGPAESGGQTSARTSPLGDSHRPVPRRARVVLLRSPAQARRRGGAGPVGPGARGSGPSLKERLRKACVGLLPTPGHCASRLPGLCLRVGPSRGGCAGGPSSNVGHLRVTSQFRFVADSHILGRETLLRRPLLPRSGEMVTHERVRAAFPGPTCSRRPSRGARCSEQAASDKPSSLLPRRFRGPARAPHRECASCGRPATLSTDHRRGHTGINEGHRPPLLTHAVLLRC